VIKNYDRKYKQRITLKRWEGLYLFNKIEKLSLDEIEDIEKLTLRWLVQATMDFGFEAYEIFITLRTM